MSILIPFFFLAAGMTVVMVLLYRNLQRLDREAGEAWRHAQDDRRARLDAFAALLQCLEAPDGGEPEVVRAARRALGACYGAEGPRQAAEADTALADAWRTLAGSFDLRDLAHKEKTRAALEGLEGADERLMTSERLYNNSATLYNNAGVTFPALLVAKRARFAPRALYRPQHLRGLTGRMSEADSESLAEKSPRIMNAYMLWAVGMSDTITEEADRQAAGKRG